MGLDIYLNSRERQRQEDAYEAAYERYAEEWGDKPDSPKKTAAREALPQYTPSESVASTKYPDHLFNRRYLRSSYNDGGFNRAVPDMVGENHDLYWIFEPVIGDDDEPYETELTVSHTQLLEDVKKRALQVAQEIREADPLRTMSVDAMLGQAEHMWHDLPTEEQVLEWYRSEQARHQETIARREAEGKDKPDWGEDGGYSNAKGFVAGFDTGLEVLAVSLGRHPLADFGSKFAPGTLGSTMGQLPQAVLVYRMDAEAKESYVQSAEIVAEFCDEAIELIKRDGSCVMTWSG